MLCPKPMRARSFLGNVFLVSYDAFAFTDKSAARALPKAERIKIIIKLFGTHCQGEFHETAVAGIFRGAGQVLGAVAGMFPAFDAFAVYNITAVAVEAVLKMSTSGIECCRKGKDLKVEPGSYASVTMRLRESSASICMSSLGGEFGS